MKLFSPLEPACSRKQQDKEKKNANKSSPLASPLTSSTEASASPDNSTSTGSSANYVDLFNEPPCMMHVTINLALTFALSLSMYLLTTNTLLTLHKLTMKSLLFSTSNNILIPDELIQTTELFQPQDKFYHGGSDDQQPTKYYDCNSKKRLLSQNECDALNSYHRDYVNSAQLYHHRSLSTKNKIKNSKHFTAATFTQTNSLRINTSFFIR